MTLALTGITLIYLYLIGRFVLGFEKTQKFTFNKTDPETNFSIIIPFRNEESNLQDLLESISELNYTKDKFEVILVDDESTDNSVKVITQFLKERPLDSILNNVMILKNNRNTSSPKKDAITTAISKIQFKWIITTDADCTFHKNWLTTIDAIIQQNTPKMIVAPVTFIGDNSFLSSFQVLDFLSLMGATIGGFGIQKPFLCNGANLIYTKDIFEEVNGYKGNDNIASGDDIFLMEKILRKYPKHIMYLKHKDAIVHTKVQPSMASLISQRKRWAAKTSSYTNTFGKLVGAIVLLMNFSILSALFLSAFGVIALKTIGYVFLIKFCIDLWLIQKTANFLGQQHHLKYYLFSSLLYPFFNVYIALSSWYGGYQWKGRRFNK